MKITIQGRIALLGVNVLLLLGMPSCGSSEDEDSSSCQELTGSPWIPQVAGVTPSNHDPNVSLIQQEIQTSGKVFGLAQGVPVSGEVAVTIDMSQDLGAYGSLTVIGQVTDFPGSVQGGAFAYLVSLNDGTNEYINLARSGVSGDCTTSGYYSCSGSSCSANSGCTINWPSAYSDRTHWDQHQGYSNTAPDYPSVNIFPTCNWTGGTAQSASDPACAFNTTFFPSGLSPARLRSGVNYTARFALISDSYTNLNDVTAGLKVTAIKKVAQRASVGGAMDINFILVGSTNVQASRTPKGQQNLNTLASTVAGYYGQSGVNVKIGSVNAFEWKCDGGGDAYATVNATQIGTLLKQSTYVVPASLASKAANIFLVSRIVNNSLGSGSNLTILGIDGAIGGPPLLGTAVSGMAVSTFDKLGQYNSSCSSSSSVCSLLEQEADFFDLGDTVAHEVGHFLGLNHLSESSGSDHDALADTPICTATQSVGGSQYITITSCLGSDIQVFSGNGLTCRADCGQYTSVYDKAIGSFCPSALACEFNNIMWWTTKNFYPSTGKSDGTLFTTQQGGIVNYHPIVQ